MELIRGLAFIALLFAGSAVGAELRQAEVCADGTTHQLGYCPAVLSIASCSATGATTGSCSATSDETDGTRYVCATSSVTALTGAEIEACSGGAAIAGSSAAETGSNSVSLSGLTTDAAHYGQIVNESPEGWYSNRLVSSSFTPSNSMASSDSMVVTLTASRSSGPAPLAVYFDATSTTHVSDDSFRQVGYYFHYDDEKAETWTYGNGGSKNVDQGGPIGAHVFEDPGTYAVRVRARDSAGEVEDAEVVITVTDPDTIYSGTSTVVISTNADTTGAPAGASLLTNQSAWPTWQSDTRYYLMAGQNYTSFGAIELNQIQDWQLMKLGAGADPIVSAVRVEQEPDNKGSNWAARGVVSDIEAVNEMDTVVAGSYILFLRCTTGGETNNGKIGPYYASQGNSNITWAHHNMYVDCSLDPDGSASDLYTFVGYQPFTVLMGNSIGGNNAPDEHNVRTWWSYKSLYQYNRFGAISDTTKHHFKMMAGSSGNSYPEGTNLIPGSGSDYISEFNIIRQNEFNEDNALPLVTAESAPQNNDGSPYIEYLSDIIWEENNFVRNGSFVDIGLEGRRMTERGSVGSPSVVTNYKPNGTPSGFDGPYYTGGSAIATESPR